MSRIALLKLIDRLLGPLIGRACAGLVRTEDVQKSGNGKGSQDAPSAASQEPPLSTASSSPPVLSRPAQARPVLVIRPGGLGDAAVLLPSLAALREALPSAVRIDILCEPRNAAVFGLAPLANTRTILYTKRPLTLRRRLRRAGYGAVLDTEQSHWFSAIFAAWTRAPIRIGFDTVPARSRLYTESVPYEPRGPEREQFRRLLAALVPALGDRLPLVSPPSERGVARSAPLDPPPSERGVARSAGGSTPCAADTAGGLGGQRPPSFAILHIGGSNPSKHWPPERYAALCDALHTRRGLRAVLVGSAADRAAAERAAALCRAAAPENRAGELSLPQTAALCAAAALFIGPDSGIAHLADLAGTPSVVLFGSGDAAKWGPCHGTAVSAAPSLACAPCSRYGTLHRRCGCRYECMSGISVESVLAALDRLTPPRP